MKAIRVTTQQREQLVDVTERVQEAVARAGLADGVCLVSSPHTTCGITVNEGWDPAVGFDALTLLQEMVPYDHGFTHAEGNSDAHIKTILVGTSVMLPVERGEVQLGRWQKVFLCEFDGPRQRQVWVTAVAGERAARQ